MFKYILFFIASLFLACNNKPPAKHTIGELQNYNESYQEEAIVLFNKDDWKVQKDSKSILMINKKENPVTTIFIQAHRLSGMFDESNFAEQLVIEQIVNGAEISSFSSKQLKNGKISTVEIIQEKRVIYINTITKNKAAYTIVCMCKKIPSSLKRCNSLTDLIYIK